MAVLAVASMKDDAAIMDELAHIPAGYSYLSQQDYRINPEHPPLIKDLSALPLLFIQPNFPTDIKPWQEDINGQWDLGAHFLYRSDNDADKLIFWSRIPMVMMMLVLGFSVFKWTRELFGSKTAVFALFLYVFSPTIITHGRFVTTDLGASLGFFAATYYFIRFLKKPAAKNLVTAGIIFGLAQLLKFSVFLLVPFFVFLLITWLAKQIYRNRQLSTAKRFKIKELIWGYLWRAVLVFVIGALVIYPVYQFHVLNYPASRQKADTEFLLSSHGMRSFCKIITWMADKPVLRAYGQYLLGLAMVLQRAVGGNTTYFMGEVSGTAWWYYFPLVYIMKVPLVIHLLSLGCLLFLAWQMKQPFWRQPVTRLFNWLSGHFAEFAMLCFLALYWLVSIRGNLNIGVRHVLPTFPFVYVLIAGQASRIKRWLTQKSKKALYFGWMILLILGGWYITANLLVFPSYLTYFNEAFGGSKNGYKYVTDSNYDWGQDLKRLAQWYDELLLFSDKPVPKIKIDYFGGGNLQYYFGDKYEPWWGDRNPADAQGSYLAVSATLLQGGRGNPAPGFNSLTGYYRWLDQYQPLTRIGNSIFVYKID